MKLNIYSQEDRLAVAQILIKNGYTVSQGKEMPEGKKAYQYFLRIEEDSKNANTAK